MKQWRVRTIETSDAKTFGIKLQSALNFMERLGLEFSVDKNTVTEAVGTGKYVAVVTGSGVFPDKKPAVKTEGEVVTGV